MILSRHLYIFYWVSLNSRHLSFSPYIRSTNDSVHKKTGTWLIHLKTEKNSAKSSYKLCRKKLPRYMLPVSPFLRKIVSSSEGGDKRRISRRLRSFLTVVSRWTDFLQTLINRGKHVWTVVLLYVDDERMNFNLIEKLQGCVFVGVSLPRKRNDFSKNFTSIQFGYKNIREKS